MSRIGSTKTTDKVLVTGGTGSLGPSVVNALKQAGREVRVLAADMPEPGLLPVDVEIRNGSVCDADTVRAAMNGISGVIHMAALLHVENPPADLTAKYVEVNVSGTATVVAAALAAGVARLVYVSTIAVYGPGQGRILDESAQPLPDSPYATTKLAGERIVLDAVRADGVPLGTVLRLGAVYGSRVKGHYRSLVQALDRGLFLPVGACTNRRSLVFHRDAAEAMVLALAHDAAAGRVYNITDGRFHSTEEIIAAICEALDRRPPTLRLPVTPVRGAFGILDAAARALGRRVPLSAKTVDKFLEDVAVDGSRAQRELGFVPKYDLKAGWRETVDEMRSRQRR